MNCASRTTALVMDSGAEQGGLLFWKRGRSTRGSGSHGFRFPLVLRQGKHGKGGGRVAHEAPRIGRLMSSFVHRGSRPETLRRILITHQPGQSPSELSVVRWYAGFFQCQNRKTGGNAVAFTFQRGPIFSEPHVCERLKTPPVPLPRDGSQPPAAIGPLLAQ